MALDDLDRLLGITEEDKRRYAESPRECCTRLNGDGSDMVRKPCSEGVCVELFCPCGQPDGSGWGPVGCPCQGDE